MATIQLLEKIAIDVLHDFGTGKITNGPKTRMMAHALGLCIKKQNAETNVRRVTLNEQKFGTGVSMQGKP